MVAATDFRKYPKLQSLPDGKHHLTRKTPEEATTLDKLFGTSFYKLQSVLQDTLDRA